MSEPAPVSVRPFADADADAWDDLVGRSCNGTFLHTRRYLGYHGDRFRDASLVFEQRGDLVGCLAAAADPADPTRVVSHPGLTYGGVVHDGSVRGEAMLRALRDAASLHAQQGFLTSRYKAVPHIYHRSPAADDSYALFRLGARRYRCDLSACIDLADGETHNRNRRRNLEKAERAGVHVVTGTSHLRTFWPVLQANLEERFGVRPVHSVDEIEHLAELFPDNIECHAALLEGELVAGVVLYKTDRVVHPQYSAASPRGRDCFALDATFQLGILEAREAGVRFYDFGTSTEDEGQVLNDSLYRYKVAYGAGGVAYEFFEYALAELTG